MNSRQESKLKMYLTIREFLRSNPSITALLPNYAEFLTALDEAIAQIQANGELQQFSTMGIADNKKQLRATLIMVAADAARKVQAGAKYAKNTVLLDETNLPETTLRLSSDIELVNTTRGLYTRIDSNIHFLTQYGLTPETQVDFKNNIDAFDQAIPQTRQSQVGKKENTMLVSQGFEAGDAAIENIDILVEIIRLSQPTFYMGYKNSHKIVNTSTTSLQLKGTVTDFMTGEPISGATFSFYSDESSEAVLIKQSAAKGGIQIKSFSEGIYTITTSKIGYETVTTKQIVSADKMSVLDVKLVKEK